MTSGPGNRIGPYEIMASLGEGGMGVVFRARDTQLLRDVALKFLPAGFENDPDRLGRFQREAQVLASLNHPNIAQVYGFQQTGASGAIVMELVEGETLAERLRRGPLALDQAIDIAKQLIDALDAAHKRGIVHRDLKPANIKLTPEGKAKVLDFGLAKALTGEEPASDSSNSPTLMSRSVAGVIMGTAAYMSPEQARGSALDARTDVWSFGCVLYEMLTAKPVFSGATVTDIIAKVIEAAPNWDLLPAETPFLIRTLLASTLTKDRNERLQHIGDARVFLKADGVPKTAAAPARIPKRRKLVTALLAVGFLAALVPASLYFMRVPEEKTEIRFEMPGPGSVATPVISPDGRHIAWAAQKDGKTAIWIRSIREITARVLPGSENAVSPFWSPDNRYIGFFADGKLKKISIEGGPATTVADTTVVVPGAWNRDGVILFSKTSGAAVVIARVSESGGDVATVIQSTLPSGNVFPQFLPDGRRFLYVQAGPDGTAAELYGGSLDGDMPVRIMPIGDISQGNFAGRYSPPGFLLFVRNGVLLAQRFDSRRMALEGEPVTIADQVGPFGVSDEGTLVYRNIGVLAGLIGQSQLAWFDRTGKSGPSMGMPADTTTLRLSPDGHRVAIDPIVGGNRDIWIIDLDRGIPNRITFDAVPDVNPRWSADGKRIGFSSMRNRGLVNKMFLRSADGIGGEEPLSPEGDPNASDVLDDWSPDNKYAIFVRQVPPVPAVDIWVKPMGDGKPFPFVESKTFIQGEARISPNGRWLAYTTNESGVYQIVVRTFPDPTRGKWQVTAQGGIYPTWRGDSRELYYLALDGKLMAVSIKAGDNFEPGQPTALFQSPLTIPAAPAAHRYDASSDGKRFLFLVPATLSANAASSTRQETITAIVNWTAALGKK